MINIVKDFIGGICILLLTANMGFGEEEEIDIYIPNSGGWIDVEKYIDNKNITNVPIIDKVDPWEKWRNPPFVTKEMDLKAVNQIIKDFYYDMWHGEGRHRACGCPDEMLWNFEYRYKKELNKIICQD